MRAAAYPSGNQFAEVVGWFQTRVSKLERGAQLPTADDIHTWVATAGAGGQVRAELLELLNDATTEHTLIRQAARRQGGVADTHARIAAAEAQATRIVEFQPAMVPGLAQTADYTRELVTNPGGGLASFGSADDVDAVIAERMRRQDVLYRRDRTIQLLLGEAALYNRPGTTETMAGQLDRLASLTNLSTVELGIIAHADPLPALPVCSFRLLDAATVILEGYTSEHQLNDRDDVAVYNNAIEHIRQAAYTGSEAGALISRAQQAQQS